MEDCVDDPDDLSALTRFEICPSWLQWEAWSECVVSERKVDPTSGNLYYLSEKTRIRNCNTFDNQCMETPGLVKEDRNTQGCSKSPLNKQFCALPFSFLLRNAFSNAFRFATIIVLRSASFQTLVFDEFERDVGTE